MSQIEEDNLTPEELKLHQDVTALRQRNAQWISEIESVIGKNAVDITHARIDHLWNWLRELGIITTQQMFEGFKDFELFVRPQLRDARANAANLVRQQAKMKKQSEASSNGEPLTLPQGSRGEGKMLHLPDGSRHRVQTRPEGQTSD